MDISKVALFTRAWIEIVWITPTTVNYNVALFTRAWIEIEHCRSKARLSSSPSSRGRGLKFPLHLMKSLTYLVALFTRAWIEIL